MEQQKREPQKKEIMMRPNNGKDCKTDYRTEKGIRKRKVIKSEKKENSKLYDSSSKLIFGNAQLCSQFLRNYMDMPILANVQPEDIEDVSERYVPLFTEERNADTVKRIKISEKDTLYFISLIEHKTQVDYNVSMQLLRYMVYIWEDYEKEMEKQPPSQDR